MREAIYGMDEWIDAWAQCYGERADWCDCSI